MQMRHEDFLGFWLFFTQRALAYAFYEALKACCVENNKSYVITPPQWGVLFSLLENDGATIGSISQKRGIDAPTVTGIVKRLEQSGLVERVHDREDRRVVRLYFTDEGRDIMRFLPGAVSNFNEIMTRGLSEAEQQDMIARLQRIVANLSEVGPGTGDRFGLLPAFFQLDQQGGEPTEQ